MSNAKDGSISRKEYERRHAEIAVAIEGMRGQIVELRQSISHLAVLTDQKFTAAQEALRLALANLDKHLDQMNEFREQLKDQTSTFVTRDLVDQMLAAVETDIKSVRDAVDALQNVQSSATGSKVTNAAWIVALIAVASTVAGIVVVLVVH